METIQADHMFPLSTHWEESSLGDLSFEIEEEISHWWNTVNTGHAAVPQETTTDDSEDLPCNDEQLGRDDLWSSTAIVTPSPKTPLHDFHRVIESSFYSEDEEERNGQDFTTTEPNHGWGDEYTSNLHGSLKLEEKPLFETPKKGPGILGTEAEQHFGNTKELQADESRTEVEYGRKLEDEDSADTRQECTSLPSTLEFGSDLVFHETEAAGFPIANKPIAECWPAQAQGITGDWDNNDIIDEPIQMIPLTNTSHACDEGQPTTTTCRFGHWMPEEDTILTLAVRKEGGPRISWTSISKNHFQGIRNPNQCKGRWKKLLRSRHAWTDEEDEIIVRSHRKGMTWPEIAAQLPGRTADQIRGRFNNSLDPSLKKTLFTAEEKRILYEAQKTYGNKWTAIATLLPGRSENQTKNCWHNAKMAQRRAMLRLAKQPSQKKTGVVGGP